MDHLDKRIRELETERVAHLLRASQPWGWSGLFRAVLGGRLGRVVRIILGIQAAIFALSIWVAVRFLTTNDVLTAVKLGVLWAVLLIVVNVFLVGLMPHMHTERVLRALKRIEILILERNRGSD